MAITDEHLTRYLETYGSEFERWPVTLTDAQKTAARALPAFADAQKVDRALAATPWPAPSTKLAERTLAAARERAAAAPVPPFLLVAALLRRPALMASILALVMGLGVTSGLQLTSRLHRQVTYNYFAYGPAYALAGYPQLTESKRK